MSAPANLFQIEIDPISSCAGQSCARTCRAPISRAAHTAPKLRFAPTLSKVNLVSVRRSELIKAALIVFYMSERITLVEATHQLEATRKSHCAHQFDARLRNSRPELIGCQSRARTTTIGSTITITIIITIIFIVVVVVVVGLHIHHGSQI